MDSANLYQRLSFKKGTVRSMVGCGGGGGVQGP